MEERHGNFDDLFQLLEAYKGQEVCCIYAEILSDEYKGFKSKLKDVHPYDSITLEPGETFDFVGERRSIVVIAVEENGQTQYLYKNYKVPKKYLGYSNDPLGLMVAQKEQLGYSVKEEQVYKLPTVVQSLAGKNK